MFEYLPYVALGFATFSCVAFMLNSSFFRVAPQQACNSTQPVSVLIPVRDEADKIAATLDAVLANQDCTFEVVVLDDDSSDATAEIVEGYAAKDERVRLMSGIALPDGWCGKQFACHQLAQHARYDQLLFIDADVTISNDAIERASRLRSSLGVELLSGFPRQRVETLGEALLIPLMYIVLLTYLPFLLMRKTRMPGASAGCGQFMLVSKQAYRSSGGHETIKSSLHDGVTLPRSFRTHGFRTDVFDASDVAECRMYRGWQETWAGLAKNAHEGIANPRLIVPFTLMLTLGYVLPALALLAKLGAGLVGIELFGGPNDLIMLGSAAFLSYMPRLVSAIRFDQAWSSVPLFPIAIVLFLVLQWTSLRRHRRGIGAAWRGRVYPLAAPPKPSTTG